MFFISLSWRNTVIQNIDVTIFREATLNFNFSN